MKSNSREVEINLQEIHPKSALDVLNMPPKRKIEVQSKNPLENISQSEKTSITLKGVNESASGKMWKKFKTKVQNRRCL
ncbi:MAG: hypothetical protein HWD61_07660 [Parachlamydiaceae bacterium]|nr:MAG: hypothetical protein HWD61_07660 [Parachlamydiaceae bacterium]